MATSCVIFGGTFDPVHDGHVALAKASMARLQADVLCVLPSGNPWQKSPLKVTHAQRVDMLNLAFADQAFSLTIDRREMMRETPTYTLQTLQEKRAELGDEASLIFLLGADQLHNLPTWKHWREMFDYANFCVVMRSGYSMASAQLPTAVITEIQDRLTTPENLKTTPYGKVYFLNDFSVDVSSTEIRTALMKGERAIGVPPKVMNYIEQFHLYRD